VAVGVHGQRDLAVSQDFHDDPGGHTLGGQEARGGVAKVVQPDGRQPSAAEQFLELSVVVSRLYWRADRCGEDARASAP
jgi:hypothetical protein